MKKIPSRPAQANIKKYYLLLLSGFLMNIAGVRLHLSVTLVAEVWISLLPFCPGSE
jgi:hypothetical protein